ncbi:MAG: terpene cyclase/mutase family protein [Kofleriaceae bacterium]|nr:terpene cyclase/mutase family protein [Kofleriaceae bacterium]
MSTSQAALLLWLEASAVAIAYASLGAASPGRRGVATLGIVLIGHAAVAAVAWTVAGGPGDAAALLRVRALFAAEAIATWGAAALLRRVRVDAGVAAAVAALLMLVLVAAPAPGEALASTLDRVDGVTVRSAAYAASPPFVASVVLGVDVVHDRALYGRFTAAVMEMHMITWFWTAGAFALAGTLLSSLALWRRRPRHLRVAATALLLAVAIAGCKKKDEGDKSPPAKAGTGSASAGTGAASGSGSGTGSAAPAAKGPTVADLEAAIAKGVDFLGKSVADGGLIGGHPGSTAMAALAMAGAPGVTADDPRLKPSLDLLAGLAKPDGSIVDKDYPVYVTAISALAFQQAKVHPDLIEKAQGYLAGKQFGEATGTDPKDKNYGGVGYGADPNEPDADLSNMHFALDALKDSTLKDRPEVLARAQKFLERCQNRSESNDQPWATNDGGFVYEPGESKAGGTLSSGSMTYAGIAGFLYTAADAKDPRVAAALDYVRANYSVDENPGMGLKGLFYYYHLMARALDLIGQRTIVDSDGHEHDWAAELAGKLLSMQKPDGSWANTDQTYWESNPAIATARALLALEHTLDAMKK